MKTLAVIPARFGSSRFPGKPLALIHGKAMIQVVYEQVKQCSSVDEVIVATDDERIEAAVNAFGGNSIMTSTHHRSGTDRIAEAVENMSGDYDLVLNVQGDEPGIEPADLSSLIALFEVPDLDIGTLVTPFQEASDFENPNRVKAVLSKSGKALYFTRSASPYNRGDGERLTHCYQHIGVYAYRKEVLLQLSSLEPSPLEIKESLEQLRWLENDFSIYASIIDQAPFGIDTPEDLEKFSQ